MVTDTRPSLYSREVAVVYIFNLIFGSGALILPYAFINVGYILGTILFLWLAFLSFITCTYVVEAMSLACAINSYINETGTHGTDDKEGNSRPLLKSDGDGNKEFLLTENNNNRLQLQLLGENDDLFQIKTKFELSEMARLYFNRPLLVFFFISTIVYLYGDLLIYLSIVGNSLRTLTCQANFLSKFCEKIGKINIFRIYITIFTLVIGTLIYFNVTKTKFVQYGTIFLRWTAFTIMIALAITKITKTMPTNPDYANFKGVPVFIGTGLYSFMCQHSLPSLLYPIRDTHRSYTPLFIYAISGVLILYVLVTYTAAFAFDKNNIEKVYTMNFLKFQKGLFFEILGCFLQLFPVVALTSSYPIVGITLRENLKVLIFNSDTTNTRTKFFLRRILIPACVIYPPYIAILFLSEHVETIVSVVGSYAGTLVQYVIPSLLLIYGQRKAKNIFGTTVLIKNFQKSPFGHIVILCVVLTWSIVGIFVVTYYNIIKIRGLYV